MTAIAAGSLHSMALSATGQPSASRVGGADRYETSAAISAATFQPGVSVAYVASGQDFPDALSGGAAAGFYKGPLLTVQPGSIPPAIASELERLKPARIVVLGGIAAVSDAVETQLALLAPTTRLSGADRYETSAAISAATFAPGVSIAYVSSGQNFPDALSGSAAAGLNAAPLLTVQPDSVPTAVAAEISRLKPAGIVLLGGTEAVSDSVQAQLGSFAPTTRLSGTDRYVTSAAISAATYQPDVPVVYITNGDNFPDALSGAAAASVTAGPILTLYVDGAPTVIAAELARLRPKKIVVLGGPAAVSYLGKSALAAYLG
ncbi:cell wall-binding repeat-containing protein [Cryobacterium sp. GrIS_2_6]|uniref:cell wall-binding repeat-containing protein n=1 Tax=Cryobacterium sp. GrIS_2_6 TaxID=3162785 RepID=UPI002DFE13A9|nr:putative cell wall-binding protein [Cryobacterium psychrotolerans]